MDGMTLYLKIKEIDDKVIICYTTANINYIKQLQPGIIDIEKIVLYKPVLLKDLKNKIDSLFVIIQARRNKDNKLAMMIL